MRKRAFLIAMKTRLYIFACKNHAFDSGFKSGKIVKHINQDEHVNEA